MVAVCGMITISTPKIPPPAPNHTKKSLGLHKQPTIGIAKSMVPKVATTNSLIKVLHAVHTRVGLEAGRDWAAGPPPKVAKTGQPI